MSGITLMMLGNFATGEPPIEGQLWGWGGQAFYSGAVGNNTSVDVSSPVQVGSLTTWSKIGASPNGFTNTVIKTDGTLWAYGRGTLGQNGDGNSLNRSSPVQVGSLTTWAQATASIYNALAVKEDNTFYIWGHNTYGQFGTNNITGNRNTPVALSGQSVATTKHSIAMNYSTVGVITTSGNLVMWGSNSSGALGINQKGGVSGIEGRSSPVQVGSLTDWSELSIGAEWVLAAKNVGAAKTFWTWGYNGNGELGHLDIVARSSPVQLAIGASWVKGVAGANHCLAIRTNGTLWAWGYNSYGQLGIGSTVHKSSPTQVGSLTTWSEVAAGNRMSIGIKTDGTLWIWGSGANGQTGQNNTIQVNSPVQLGGLTTWAAAECGDQNTVAIKTP
jgi:alpha-tubulin suppressor-like RCC1 family protein